MKWEDFGVRMRTLGFYGRGEEKSSETLRATHGSGCGV